jgi:hypothetical protein
MRSGCPGHHWTAGLALTTVVVGCAGRVGKGQGQMTWIIIALIFAAAAAAGFRIQALTREEPPEPALNHRWRAMGGGQASPQPPPTWRGGPGGG